MYLQPRVDTFHSDGSKTTQNLENQEFYSAGKLFRMCRNEKRQLLEDLEESYQEELVNYEETEEGINSVVSLYKLYQRNIDRRRSGVVKVESGLIETRELEDLKKTVDRYLGSG